MIVYVITIAYWIILSFSSLRHQEYLMMKNANISNKKAEKKRTKLIILSILPIFLLMSLRAKTVGADTHQYYNRYEIADQMLSYTSYKSEIGYNLIGYFFHNILHFPWQLYLTIISAFICIVFGIFIKNYSENTIFSSYLHLVIGLFTMSMSGIRQTLAIAFCLIALIISQNHQRSKRIIIISVIIIFLAYTIHNSALCFLPIIIISHIKINKTKAIFINLSAIICGLFLRNPFVRMIELLTPSKYSYINLYVGYAINFLVILITITIPAFCLLCSFEEKDGKYSNKISMMYIFSALNILFTCLSINNGQIGRLAYYFQSTYLSIIPSSIRRFSIKSKKK